MDKFDNITKSEVLGIFSARVRQDFLEDMLLSSFCFTWKKALILRLTFYINKPGDPNTLLHSIWASFYSLEDFPVAQMVKNLLAMQETWIRSLG